MVYGKEVCEVPKRQIVQYIAWGCEKPIVVWGLRSGYASLLTCLRGRENVSEDGSSTATCCERWCSDKTLSTIPSFTSEADL